MLDSLPLLINSLSLLYKNHYREVKKVGNLAVWLEQQESGLRLEDIWEWMPALVFGGYIDNEDGLIIEAANKSFSSVFGISEFEFPCRMAEILGGEMPLNYEALERKVRTKGWSKISFELVPGSMAFEGSVFSFSNEKILAMLKDITEEKAYKRMVAFKEKYFELIKLYESRNLIQGLISSLLQIIEAEWGGIFVWDSSQERWVLQFDAVLPMLLGQKGLKRYLDFALQLGAISGGETPCNFGGLNVVEGGKWEIPCLEAAGSWKNLMEQHQISSLRAGTLITGSIPAVFLILSGENGKLGKINNQVVDAFWAVAVSVLEKNRVVEGMSHLYQKDPLTGFYSSSRLKEMVKVEIQRSMRYGYPLSFIAMEIGDLEGLSKEAEEDKTLYESIIKEIGNSVKKNLRAVDITGRLKNTLILILPHTPAAGAELVAERLRANLENLKIGKYSLKPIKISTVTLNGEVSELDEVKEFLNRCGFDL